MKRFLVIGSNSFSGASFTSHLLNSGFDVLGVSRSEEPAHCFLPYRWDTEHLNSSKATATVRGHFTFIQADLNTELDKIMAVADDFRPEYVANFSAQGMVAESWSNPVQWFQTNLMANVALTERLRVAPWLKRYIHASTPEVYGSCAGIVTEGAPLNPSTPYAASKAACDLHLRTILTKYSFPVIWTRAANVYGPGQGLYRIVPQTILRIKLGQKLRLHGGGHSIRSFIHIRDVAEATLAVALKGSIGSVYHLSTHSHITIRGLVNNICEQMNVQFEDVVEVVEDRPSKDAAYLLDTKKTFVDLNWNPNITLNHGINDSIQWFNLHFETLKTQPAEYIHKP